MNNKIKDAVNKLGGPTRTACHLKVSNVTIHDWINSGRVKNFDKAEQLAALTGIPFETLRGEVVVEAVQ